MKVIMTTWETDLLCIFAQNFFLVYYMITNKKVTSIPISFLLILQDDNILKWFMFGLANLASLFTIFLSLDAIISSAWSIAFTGLLFLFAFWSRPNICTCTLRIGKQICNVCFAQSFFLYYRGSPEKAKSF